MNYNVDIKNGYQISDRMVREVGTKENKKRKTKS